MKIFFCTILTILIVAGNFAAAQGNENPPVQRTEIIFEKEKRPVDCMGYRFGLWIPRDKEMAFEGNYPSTGQAAIDQSQAIGLDLHYRKGTNNLLAFNMTVGAWYSSYTFKFDEVLQDPNLVQDASSWAVIIPLTVGASLELIPDNMVMPHVMAGVGIYTGISGVKKTYQVRKEDDTKVQFAFGGFLGAGVDVYLSPSFGLTAALKYHVVEYKDYLWTRQKVFNGMQFMAGITTKL